MSPRRVSHLVPVAALAAPLLAAIPARADDLPLDAIDVAGRRSREVAAPGLNLATPARSGSRLGLTPLETPASLDVIGGETIRARGQNTVEEAVTQNAVGITSVAGPATATCPSPAAASSGRARCSSSTTAPGSMSGSAP